MRCSSWKSCWKRPRRPFVILGGTRWSEEAVGLFQRSAESWALPVGCSFRRQMLFDHLHPCYAGDVGIGPNPKLAAAIKRGRPRAAASAGAWARCRPPTTRC